MTALKNPHRLYEESPVAWQAVSQPSGDFRRDFTAMISWCAANGNVDRYHRREVFRMSTEPYGIEVAAMPDPASRTEALLAHAWSIMDKNIGQWQWLYESLADQDSKMLLLNVLAYRAIGWKFVPMPLDSAAFWECLGAIGKMEEDSQDLNETPLAGYAPYRMRKVDLNRIGVNVELFSDAFGIFNEFVYSQYAYRGRRQVLGPRKGAYVVDCGACFGGTSLSFADSVGPEGKVISYEFFPENVAIFEENMRLNPELAQRIHLIKQPVWWKPDVLMITEGSGPATQVHMFDQQPAQNAKPNANLPQGRQFRSTTIDETVKAHRLPRVDHIKMDIEGAEISALRGAADTIRRFRPTLAICVYHNLTDFFEVPQLIRSFDASYKFYLQHSTVHGDETVIFASAEGPPRPVAQRPRFIQKLQRSIKKRIRMLQ